MALGYNPYLSQQAPAFAERKVDISEEDASIARRRRTLPHDCVRNLKKPNKTKINVSIKSIRAYVAYIGWDRAAWRTETLPSSVDLLVWLRTFVFDFRACLCLSPAGEQTLVTPVQRWSP